MWNEYLNVTTIEEALSVLAEKGERARIVAGATDLILEIERGVRTGIETLIDVTRIPKLDLITIDEDDVIHLGPLVTHNHCVESRLIRARAYPLARAAWEVGAPQIRNRGTIAGNLITRTSDSSPDQDCGCETHGRGLKVQHRENIGVLSYREPFQAKAQMTAP